jgi:RNA polymerase sigma-70 factor (ECF subfamily)
LTTAEIAHAFLVPEATMAKRLVRAKQKIAHAGIPYRVPEAALLPARTSGVLAVLYLLFNEGYGASGGADLMRHDLAAEAIAICRVLATLLPEEPEVSGLLALMLFQDARRDSRLDADGEIVTLEHQDRTRWNRPMIDEASALLAGALARQNAGPYQLQAAIASGHATSEAGSTDWVEIARLYALLARIMQSPVVELNRAVAVAMADGPDAGLALLDELETEGSLARYYLLPASRADLLRRLGRHAEAARCYEQALAMAPTEPERRFLRGRMAEMTALP